jgi:Universal stress protein UspA and related nucleotide-binding proteins
MGDKILVATDGSEYGTNALKFAMNETKMRGGELFVIHVIHAGLYENKVLSTYCQKRSTTYHHVKEALLSEAKDILDGIRDTVKSCGLPVEVKTKIGHPGEEIVKFSDKIGADLIVVGSHGKSGLKRALLGSVSTFVVTHSPVTTIVVKN